MIVYKKETEHFIDTMCFQKCDSLERRGMKFNDKGLCERRFDFYNGRAIEVNQNNYPIPTKYGGMALGYPRISEINKSPEMREKISKVTGKTGDFDFYDIAVSLGHISRQAMSNKQK